MSARLTTAPNPIVPADGREIRRVGLPPGTTLESLVRAQAPRLAAGPCVVLVNERPVAREQWGQTAIADGDRVTVCAAAAGGEDSDPVRMVLQIAVAVGALYVGNLAWASAWQGAAAAAAVQVGGNYLVNSLVPPRLPEITRDGGIQGSPTYSIQATRNRARHYQPMPVLIGEHRMWPDSASQPFTEYNGGEMWLYQAFDFGLTEMELADFRVGETSVDELADFQLEISGPDGGLFLWPGNVDTTSGAALTEAAGWVQRTTSIDATQIAVDLIGQIYKVGDQGTESLSVEIKGQYRIAGSADPWTDFLQDETLLTRTEYWSKGYWADAAQTEWVQLTFDPSFDSGKYTDGAVVGQHSIRIDKATTVTFDVIWRWRTYTEREAEGKVQVSEKSWNRPNQKILDPAPPEQYPATVNSLFLENDTAEPIRRTIKFDVPQGQYEVRMQRVTPEHTADDEISSVNWEALKTYQPDAGDYEGQKRVAIRVRATGQLNGPIDRLSAMARGRIPVLQTDDSWEVEYTLNPAWWFLHVALGRYKADGTRLYGGGVALTRTDLDVIEDWAAWCTTNGLTIGAVFDRQQTVDDLLRTIAQVGRARISWATGKLGVVINRPGDPQAVFGMSNIIAGTFRVSYVTEKLPSEIEAHYVDPRIGWQGNVLRVPVPFAPADAQPARQEFKGVFDEAQVAAEANLVAADQYYHRRRISWETDMEGLVVTLGDVVLLAHDMTDWDFSGRLIASDTTDAILSTEIEFTVGEDHYLIAVQPDGTMSTHLVRNDGGTTDQVHFEDPLPADPGNDAIDWRFLFGPVTEPGRRVKLIEVRPTRYDRARLTAVDEVQAYYDAAGGSWSAAPLPETPLTGQVQDLNIAEALIDREDNVQLLVSWDTVNAPLAALRYRVNSRGWETRPATDTEHASIPAKVGDQVTVQVQPLESADQARIASVELVGGAEQTYTVTGVADLPNDIADFEIEIVGTNSYLRWTGNTAYNLDHYELRFSGQTAGAIWEQSVPLRTGIAPGTTEISVPSQVGTYLLKAFDRAGQESANAAAVISTIGEIEGLNVVETVREDPEFPGTRVDVFADQGWLQLGPADDIDAWDDLANVARLDYYGSGYAATGTYTFAETLDLGSIFTSRVRTELDVEGVNGAGGTVTGDYGAQLQVRTTNDDPAGAPVWSAWQPFVVGDYTVRAYQFRLILTSSNPDIAPRVTGLFVEVDMPDRTIGERDLVCPAGGLTVTFQPAFQASPALGLAHQDMLETDKAQVTAKDRAGFHIRYFDSAGGDVERTFDYVAKGYGKEQAA